MQRDFDKKATFSSHNCLIAVPESGDIRPNSADQLGHCETGKAFSYSLNQSAHAQIIFHNVTIKGVRQNGDKQMFGLRHIHHKTHIITPLHSVLLVSIVLGYYTLYPVCTFKAH